MGTVLCSTLLAAAAAAAKGLNKDVPQKHTKQSTTRQRKKSIDGCGEAGRDR